MKRFIYVFMAMTLFAGISISCEKDLNGPANGIDETVAKGRVVHFGASSPATKTVYGAQDAETHGWPVYWCAGDSVLIYSPNASTEGPNHAVYTIDSSSEGKEEGYDFTKSADLVTPENPIIWKGDDTAEHTFYATYPVEGVSIDEEGIATFPINFNQTCTITADASNNQFAAQPDMQENAYMVAAKTTTFTESVGLPFHPIMTTLDIVVNGPSESGAVLALTGISVTFQLTNKVSDTHFKYDIVNNTMVDFGSNDEVTVFVSIKNARNNNQGFIDLETNQSVKLTVMLPPNAIGNEKTARIRVHAQSKNNTSAINKSLTIGKTAGETVVDASKKRAINLPNINPETATANAWMTPLDDDILMSQLSIPGTNKSFTYSAGTLQCKTQLQSIENQLNVGIRAFELSAAWRTAYRTFYTYAKQSSGIDNNYTPLSNIFDALNTFLTANDREAVVVLINHYSDTSTGINSSGYSNNMKSFLDGYRCVVVSDLANLTLGDCRGKILVLSRDTYDNGPIGAYVSSYTHQAQLQTGTIYIGTTTVPIDVQYYYHGGSSFSTTKTALIKNLLDKSAKFSTESQYLNNWAFNFSAGYTNDLDALSTNAHGRNAEISNKYVFDSVSGATEPGPTGIVFMDFAGTRSVSIAGSNFTVYGDVLPQAIIDNNYKFPMKKKTSATN